MRIVKRTDGTFVFAYHGELAGALNNFSKLCALPGFWDVDHCFRKISASANFDYLDLRNAIIEGISLWNHGINRLNAENADMYWADIHEIVLSDCIFIRTLLQGAHIVDCQFINCDFQQADLSRDNLGGRTRIENSVFERCNFYNANLLGALFDNVSFVGVDFTHAIVGEDGIGHKTTYKNCVFKETALPRNKEVYDIVVEGERTAKS